MRHHQQKFLVFYLLSCSLFFTAVVVTASSANVHNSVTTKNAKFDASPLDYSYSDHYEDVPSSTKEKDPLDRRNGEADSRDDQIRNREDSREPTKGPKITRIILEYFPKTKKPTEKSSFSRRSFSDRYPKRRSSDDEYDHREPEEPQSNYDDYQREDDEDYHVRKSRRPVIVLPRTPEPRLSEEHVYTAHPDDEHRSPRSLGFDHNIPRREPFGDYPSPAFNEDPYSPRGLHRSSSLYRQTAIPASRRQHSGSHSQSTMYDGPVSGFDYDAASRMSSSPASLDSMRDSFPYSDDTHVSRGHTNNYWNKFRTDMEPVMSSGYRRSPYPDAGRYSGSAQFSPMSDFSSPNSFAGSASNYDPESFMSRNPAMRLNRDYSKLMDLPIVDPSPTFDNELMEKFLRANKLGLLDSNPSQSSRERERERERDRERDRDRDSDSDDSDSDNDRSPSSSNERGQSTASQPSSSTSSFSSIRSLMPFRLGDLGGFITSRVNARKVKGEKRSHNHHHHNHKERGKEDEDHGEEQCDSNESSDTRSSYKIVDPPPSLPDSMTSSTSSLATSVMSSTPLNASTVSPTFSSPIPPEVPSLEGGFLSSPSSSTTSSASFESLRVNENTHAMR